MKNEARFEPGERLSRGNPFHLGPVFALVRMARVQVPDGVCAVDLLASASHGDTAREHLDGRLAPFLCVHISAVVRVATDDDVAREDLLRQCRFLQEEEAAAAPDDELDEDGTSASSSM